MLLFIIMPFFLFLPRFINFPIKFIKLIILLINYFIIHFSIFFVLQYFILTIIPNHHLHLWLYFSTNSIKLILKFYWHYQLRVHNFLFFIFCLNNLKYFILFFFYFLNLLYYHGFQDDLNFLSLNLNSILKIRQDFFFYPYLFSSFFKNPFFSSISILQSLPYILRLQYYKIY